MSKDLNRVQLLGRLGAAPEVRYGESGLPRATFSVATSRRWQDAGGQAQEETEWSRVVAWGRLAEVCGEYLHRGSRVYLEGRLKTRSWEEAETGTRHALTEVVADELIMLDGRHIDGDSTAPNAETAPTRAGAMPARDQPAVTAPPDGRTSRSHQPAANLAPGITPRPRVVTGTQAAHRGSTGASTTHRGAHDDDDQDLPL